MSEPITRSEMYLAALSGEAVTPPEPITRMDMYMAYLNGMTDTYPDPITRTEQYLYKLCQNGMGGGGGVTIRNQNKTITQNGQYKADSGYTGLGTVTVNVPQEDPVLQDKTVTENGTVTADAGFDGLGVVTVNVESSGGGDSYALINSLMDRSITRLYSPTATILSQEAMCQNNKNLVEVDLPNVTSVAVNAFNGCTALTTVNLPKVELLDGNGKDTFRNAAIKEINLRANKGTVASFSNCTKLEYADIFSTNPNSWATIGNAFQNCTSFRILILRANRVITLTITPTTSFQNTLFSSGNTGGVLLIPSALVESYKTATNWSVIYGYGTNRFLALEDFTIDGTTNGEIDWDKVNALFE